MKSIKIFLSIVVFALSLAFNVHARDVPQIQVKLKTKAVKVVSENAINPAAPNFVRTDCLVMYESVFQAIDLSRVRSSVLIIRTKIAPVTFTDTKFFRSNITREFKYKQEFAYV